MTFETVENEVTEILKYNVAARADDMALYCDYCYSKIGTNNLGAGWLEKVFSDRRLRIAYGISPYETVSRIRRFVQAKNEELRPTAEQKQEKKRAENDYRKYLKEQGVSV